MIFQLLTPVISMTFAVCFIAIYLLDRSKDAPAILSIAYLVGSIALLFDIFRLNFDPILIAYLTNILYSATLCLTVIAFARHFGRPSPLKILSSVAIIEFATLSYFIFVEPDVGVRAFVANFAATFFMGSALLVVPYRSRHLINTVLFWVIAITSAQFTLRTGLSAFFINEPLTDTNYSQSIFAIGLHFSVAVFSLILAVCACMAFGLNSVLEIKNNADADPLTQLLNQTAFEREVRQKIELAHSNNLPVSLILLEVDQLDWIRNTFGHAFSDEVFKTVGHLMEKSIHNGDLVGRVSGEQLCIMLDMADLQMARFAAETIRQAMEQQEFTHGEQKFFLTTSLGVASLIDADTYDVMLQRANKALREAQVMGSNQVRPKRQNFLLQHAV